MSDFARIRVTVLGEMRVKQQQLFDAQREEFCRCSGMSLETVEPQSRNECDISRRGCIRPFSTSRDLRLMPEKFGPRSLN